MTVHVDGLSPGTKYDVRVAALQVDPDGDTTKTFSSISKITTTGTSSQTRNIYLLILILLILLLLLIICCICCVVCRHRGQNYPVSQREREQGREPILGKPDYKTYVSKRIRKLIKVSISAMMTRNDLWLDPRPSPRRTAWLNTEIPTQESSRRTDPSSVSELPRIWYDPNKLLQASTSLKRAWCRLNGRRRDPRRRSSDRPYPPLPSLLLELIYLCVL